VTKIGGISEMRRVSAAAQAAGKRLVPHNAYFGPGYLASMQVVATLPQESPFERLYLRLEASLFGDWLEARNGKVTIPQGPGLGCDPDPAVVQRYRDGPDTVIK
jgi:D-galactarolactone cycloisomerase